MSAETTNTYYEAPDPDLDAAGYDVARLAAHIRLCYADRQSVLDELGRPIVGREVRNRAGFGGFLERRLSDNTGIDLNTPEMGSKIAMAARELEVERWEVRWKD
jgi:hypothetical protein